MLEKIREDVTGGSSNVFTRKAVANESFFLKSKQLCKSTVGIDGSQLYPYSMCQDMPTGLYTRWDYDEETQKIKQGKIEFDYLKKKGHAIVSSNHT